MNAREAIKLSLDSADMICKSYLEDLSDEDLLTRPAEKANHVAWQLGHLISSTRAVMEQTCPGSMPELPEGFADKYTKETSGLNDAAAVHSKAEYLKLMEDQRAATLAALDKLTDEDLDKPAPEAFRSFAETVGAVFAMEATHWLMHAGQWVIVRRQLGRAPLF